MALTPDEFVYLGAERLGYIAPALSDDVIEFYRNEFPLLSEQLARGHRVYVLFAGDGSPICIRGTCLEILAVAEEQGMSASVVN